ncbi:MAG: flagellar assembly protein FliW [Halobacillus sp.]|uniref:flagellar assembly protein FliW n=1 Tax=Halobacillus sp. TaxID=56800 RepID=UPI003BAED264
MKIATKHFGHVEVDETKLLKFHNGLPGFEMYKTYALIPVDESAVYFALQSVEAAGVALIVSSPYIFFKGYVFNVDEDTKQELGLTSPDDVLVYNVLTLREPFKDSTMNLQAPVIINVKNRKSKQLILNDQSYQTRHLLVNGQEGGGSRVNP